MAIRKSSRFKGLLTKRSSVDSTSTVKSFEEDNKEEEKKDRKSKVSVGPLDYGDDDALIESGFWSDIKVMLWDFIPDYTPLNFILIHLFSYLVFLSFRSVSFPAPKEAVKVEENVQVQYEYLSYIKDYFDNDEKQFELIVNTLKLLVILLLINLLVLFIVLSIRFVFMKFLFEPFSKISRSAVLIAYSVDPSIFYFIWSLINYTIYLRCLKETPNNFEYKTYDFRIFGFAVPKGFWIDTKCFSWSKSVYHLHILFAVRKLILSSLLFLFELQFLANYSTDLATYLNEQSCLRKFTLKWLNYVYYRKSLRMRELDELVDKFLAVDMSIVKKSYNTVWIQHRKDDFKIFRPILSKWQHHNIKNDLNLSDYNGTNFLKDLWIDTMAIKPTVNWIVLNYVIHNPPEILLFHHSIQLICKETIDYCSKILFDQIYESLTLLRNTEPQRVVNLYPKPVERPEPSGEDFREDEKDDFYQYDEPGKVYRISQLGNVDNVDDMHITRDFELVFPDQNFRPARARKYRNRNEDVPQLMKYRATIVDPDMPVETCMNVLINNKEETVVKEEVDDGVYITRELCGMLDQGIVDDFFLSYDISNCGAISYENFMTTVINMCSIRKKLITTLKNQRSILELVGKLISIILWFMSFVALLLSFRINKNIVLPSTIGLFSATIVALSYMYTSFITAIMFVVISNPYNVGDRVRIDGKVMYVRRITTYNTEFRASHGQHIIYQNILLSKMLIINESRAKHATLEVSLKLSASTTPAALKMLRDNVKTYVNGRPREFVNNSIFFHCDDLQVSHYVHLVIWATSVESWSNVKAVFGIRSDLMIFVANQCKLLGIGYERPLSPLYFKNSLNVGGLEPVISNIVAAKSGEDKHRIVKRGEKAKSLAHVPPVPKVKAADSEPRSFQERLSPIGRNVFERPLAPQRSVGPIDIEPTFPDMTRPGRRTPGSKVPPVPPFQTLQYVHKNALIHNPPHHHLPKNTDIESYENVWLNTWSPDNRPNRMKTFSFGSDFERRVAEHEQRPTVEGFRDSENQPPAETETSVPEQSDLERKSDDSLSRGDLPPPQVSFEPAEGVERPRRKSKPRPDVSKRRATGGEELRKGEARPRRSRSKSKSGGKRRHSESDKAKDVK